MKRFLGALALMGSVAAGNAYAQGKWDDWKGNDNNNDSHHSDSQYDDNNGSWVDYSRYDGCVGTSKCREGRSLRVPLENRNVEGVRFDVRSKSFTGRLRVSIDGRTIERELDPNGNRSYNLRVGGYAGRDLTFEILGKGYMDIRDIEVQYSGYGGNNGYQQGGTASQGEMLDIVLGGGQNGQNNSQYGSSSGQWSSLGDQDECIGNRKCRNQTLRIRIQDYGVYAVRFTAHGRSLSGSQGEVQVSVNGTRIDREVRIGKTPQTYEVRANGERGSELIFEVTNNADVMIREVEVMYGSR